MKTEKQSYLQFFTSIMTICVTLGSVNNDHVYYTEGFLQSGLTLLSDRYEVYAGGKGANQSIAVGQAGIRSYLVANIGWDGIWMKKIWNECKWLNYSLIKIKDDQSTGSAIIQITPQGDSGILLYPGANHSWKEHEIKIVIEKFHAGDIILLQNETNMLSECIRLANEKGLSIFLNPSPISRIEQSIKWFPFVDNWIMNEKEAKLLFQIFYPSVKSVYTRECLYGLREKLPLASRIIITLGGSGCICYTKSERRVFEIPAFKCSKPIVDTTCAGDSFLGYFVAGLIYGIDFFESLCQTSLRRTISKKLSLDEWSLLFASAAASLCVIKNGALESIPEKDIVLEHLFSNETFLRYIN